MTYLIPQLPSGGGVTLNSTWKFSTTITAADPGSKNFRYNNATPADVTELYFNDTTNEGSDAGTILALLVAGNRIYVQQQDDAANATLFELIGGATDNGGWWTVPVSVVSTLALPVNNKSCVVVINLGSGGIGTTLVALRQASVLRVNSTTMIDDTVLTLPLEATTVYSVEMSLRFNRLAGAPASSLKFNFNNTFGLTQGSLHGEQTLLNVHFADFNVIPDNAAGDTILDPVLLGVQYRWIARGVIVTSTAGNWVLEFAQNVATTTAVVLVAGSYLKATRIGTES
jgi:hypothetical protein